MKSPIVSFVVPCYKLAHLLPECITSILSQSFSDFEILIMDDCSPDNTSEVAQSFRDPRVKYIRNDSNLRHLRNYNKGIGLTRGKYVWLISADDYLRKPYILEKYVGLLDKHPNVGYVFCPGLGVRDEVETRILGRYSERGDSDRIIPGHVLLKKLLRGNFVLCPSGLVRRECYDRVSFFPLTMPWAGDWYLWCLFALYYDVGYFAEPMLCYREHHDLSMTTKLARDSLEGCAAEEVSIPWIIRKKALDDGYVSVAKECLNAVSKTYARILTSERYRESRFFMNFEALEESLRQYTSSETEQNWVRARVYESVGNEFYWQGNLASAKQFYQTAIKKDPRMASVHLKLLLLALGKPGDFLRRTIFSFR
ncbi:glycosyltransferase family 2 protein [Methylobacter svalbardensis]|uniref:glycosyltransferase family 2 protein n=1 Tax=Methylobacter svalbardensis TaxID=3080016 RepID=UPI0030EC3CD9